MRPSKLIIIIMSLINLSACQTESGGNGVVTSDSAVSAEIILNTKSGDDIKISKYDFIYSSDYSGTNVRKIAFDGTTEIISSALSQAGAIALDSNSVIYVSAYDTGVLMRVSTTQIDTLLTGLAGPAGLYINQETQTLYIAANAAQQVLSYKLTSGEISTVAQGNLLNWPTGITADPQGNLYVANMFAAEIIVIKTDETMKKLVSLPATVDGRFNLGYITYQDGFVYVNHYDRNKVYRVNAGNGSYSEFHPAVFSKLNLSKPTGIAFSSSAKLLFITDELNGNQRLIKLILSV